MDIDKIEKLIKLAKDTGVSELDVKESESGVRIVCAPPAFFNPSSSLQLESNQVVAGSTVAPVDTQSSVVNQDIVEIKSPMVGTFYSSSSPESKNYAAVGDKVQKGDVLCIIEAMKMMNKIESSCSGVVKRILVENQSLIEYDEVLFLIEKQD